LDSWLKNKQNKQNEPKLFSVPGYKLRILKWIPDEQTPCSIFHEVQAFLLFDFENKKFSV
jgi:hypothetical protein